MIDRINSQGNIASMLQTLRSHQAQAAGGMMDIADIGSAGSTQKNQFWQQHQVGHRPGQ